MKKKVILSLIILFFCVLLSNTSFCTTNQYGISDKFQVTYDNVNYNITVPTSELYNFNDVSKIFAYRYGSLIYVYLVFGNVNSCLKYRNYLNSYRLELTSSYSSDSDLSADNLCYQFAYAMSSGKYSMGYSLSSSLIEQLNPNSVTFLYATEDVLNYDDYSVFFAKNSVDFKNPEIQNKDKITKLDFDSMAIFLNDYDSKERLYLHRLEVATTVDLGDGNTVYYYNDKVFGLDFFTSYYNNDLDHPGYTIPKYQFELENNKIYYFLLSSSATSLDHSYNLIDYTEIENAYDGLGVSTSDSFTYEQLQQEQQKKQNDQLEENNKTNKNIFETIKEMLSYLNPFSDNFILLKLWDFLGTLISYINPFSDNFLGKKIVELIGNLLKSLFVPSDEYFNNFFSDLKQWFSDRFGLLFYPFELIIDILNRITNINLSEPKFNIPEIKEPSTGKILFKAQDYNFNNLLDTKEFKIMHDIYFVIVDAIIIFALANLIKSKLKEVETE